MDLFNSFIDTITEFFIKMASYLPTGDNISTSSYFTSLATIKGYINYFIPFNEMATIWNAFVIIIIGIVIGFVILKWTKGTFIK